MKIVKIEESQIEELLSLIHDMARFEKLDHEVTATKESLYETIFVKKSRLLRFPLCR